MIWLINVITNLKALLLSLMEKNSVCRLLVLKVKVRILVLLHLFAYFQANLVSFDLTNILRALVLT